MSRIVNVCGLIRSESYESFSFTARENGPMNLLSSGIVNLKGDKEGYFLPENNAYLSHKISIDSTDPVQVTLKFMDGFSEFRKSDCWSGTKINLITKGVVILPVQAFQIYINFLSRRKEPKDTLALVSFNGIIRKPVA